MGFLEGGQNIHIQTSPTIHPLRGSSETSGTSSFPSRSASAGSRQNGARAAANSDSGVPAQCREHKGGDGLLNDTGTGSRLRRGTES